MVPVARPRLSGQRPMASLGARAALILAAFLLLLLSLGCARLPEVRSLREPQHAQPPPADTKAEQKLTLRQARSGAELRRRDLLEEAATGHPLIPGNRVSLLFDGPQTLGAMMESISHARDSINLETYIFDQDDLGMKFADLLIAKQREGVQVNILYDCVGTLGTPEAFFERMREAGIHLCPYHPINPLAHLGRWRINNRDHRKILVVDGEVAFTGGANISGAYRSGSLFRSRNRRRGTLGWRDTHLKIQGPAVAALQLLFVENWLGQPGAALAPRSYFPPLAEAGPTGVRVLGSAPGGDFEIYRAYILAMEEAAATIHLTAAYFVPDPQLLQALARAAQRGVKVEIILTSVSDSSLVQHGSRSCYAELLGAGVRLFELRSSVLHAKTAVIDGVWSTVGSTNLDMRSFLFNKEVNVIVLDLAFGQEMESAFQEDLRNSQEITRAAWERRSRGDRIKQWVARRLRYWL